MWEYLSPTQTDIKLVVVFSSLGGETRPIHDWPHWTQGTQVVGQRSVSIHMREGAIVKTPRVLLDTHKTHFSCSTVLKTIIVMHYLLFYSYLVVLASRTTGLTGLLAINVMPREESVGRAFLALVGVFVDEVSSRTGDTGRAILLTQHSTGVATRCWAIHRISHCDRVDLCNVIYILTHLGEKDTADENFPRDKKVLKTNFCCEYLHQRLCWYVGKPMCTKPKHFWSWCGCTLVSVYSLPMIPQHLCSSCLHPMEKTHWFSK